MVQCLALTHLFLEAEVERACPWYYRMKALIGERPNAKPVGIGNSATELDLDVLAPGTQDNTSGCEDSEPIMLSENDDDEVNKGQAVEDRNRTRGKRSASVAALDEDVKPKLGTPARANMSKPTAAGPKLKKLKGLEELVEITMTEEVTRQKEIDLEIQQSKEKASRAQVKEEVKKAAIEAKKEKVKQAHEVEMMKLQLELAKMHQVGIGASQGSVHSPGMYPPFDLGLNSCQLDGMSANDGVGQGGL